MEIDDRNFCGGLPQTPTLLNSVKDSLFTMSITHITDNAQLDGILGQSPTKVSVIDFHASWCGPCHQIAPVFEAKSREYPNVNFLKCDVDNASAVAAKYKVTAMPTFIFFKGSKQEGTIRGVDRDGLARMLNNLAGTAGGAINLDGAQRDAQGNPVMFESKDSEGKRVIHTTRFDAQLHAIHSTVNSFIRDPPSGEFDGWAEKFGDVSSPERTEQISKDLEKHEELRRAMEKLVPEQVDYPTFWKRYYFLRHVIETEEKRRREMLKDAADPTDEVAWDEDSDDETPAPKDKITSKPSLNSSKETLKAEKEHLKPAEGRKSGDGNSQADSDASYDVVSAQSGATSRAPGSPGETKKKDDDSDEDWE